MKHVIEPLARIPGVRLAALITPDGVPISMESARQQREQPKPAPAWSQAEDDSARREKRPSQAACDAEELNALAGLSTSWLSEITRSVAPLSWAAPRHLWLRAARGTLVIMQAPGALLLVVLEGGTRPAELRLSMGAAVARMERHLRERDPKSDRMSDGLQPSGIFPSRSISPRSGANTVHSTGNGVPEASGE